MKLCVALILATIFVRNDGQKLQKHTGKTQDRVPKTAVDFAKLIHIVKGYRAEETNLSDEKLSSEDDDVKDPSDYRLFDLDYYRNEMPSKKTAVNLFQKNYNEKEPARIRLHVIKNPTILEKYQKNLKKLSKHQSLDGTNTGKYNFKDFLVHQRRNAVFRLDTSSMERDQEKKTNRAMTKKKIQNSIENDRFDNYNEKKTFDNDKRGYNKRNDHTDKDHNIIDIYIDEDSPAIKKKSIMNDDIKQDNAWDVITKKYDWKDENRNTYDDSPKNNRQSKHKKAANDDDWNKKITKQDLDNWDSKLTKSEKSFDQPKRDKKEKKKREWDSSERRPTNRNKKEKPKRGWDSNERKPVKSFDSRVDKDKNEKPKRGWDSGERGPEKSSHNRPYRDKKEKLKKEWDESKPAKKFDDRNKKEKTKGWDSVEVPKKIKAFDKDKERQREKDSEWDTTPHIFTTFRTTRQRVKESAKDDWSEVKIPSYYSNSRPKKSRSGYENNGFFGRTPIPYVGRQGIYVEK